MLQYNQPIEWCIELLIDWLIDSLIDFSGCSESPAADFGAPASVDYQFYTQLLAVREDNSPLIGRMIRRDICGQTFKVLLQFQEI